MTDAIKILFTGGGTGGHVMPIVSIVREIKLLYPSENLMFFYVGPHDPFEAMMLREEDIRVKTILCGKLRRHTSWQSFLQNAFDVFIKIPIGVAQALWSLFFTAPDIVFSKGGYGSFPVIISAWLLQIPIFLHASDVAPGLAEKITNRFALEIFTAFPKTEYFSPVKSITVGNPIRRNLLEGSQDEAKKKFNIMGGKPAIFITGGSQGAQRINDVLLAALPELLQYYEILHQTGDLNLRAVEAEAEVVMPPELKKYYHAFSFLREQDLRNMYKMADLIIARAGSGTIFEIAAAGKPSILVPLPEAAQNHQYKNAYAYASHGAALVLEEANLYPHFLLERIHHLFLHPAEMDKMKQAALNFASPKSAQVIAEYLLGYLMQ